MIRLFSGLRIALAPLMKMRDSLGGAHLLTNQHKAGCARLHGMIPHLNEHRSDSKWRVAILRSHVDRRL